MTGHWIEECVASKWTIETTLLGFVQMNTAHNGTRLGQALYKVCNRLRIVAKVRTDSVERESLLANLLQVGHITCDNAKNNDTMLEEFARCYQAKTGRRFDIKRRQIRYVFFRSCSHGTQSTRHACSCRCLAHIINLATQAVISAHSKSKFYNGNPEDDHVPEDMGGTERDEIGIVRAICVKVHSTLVLHVCIPNTNILKAHSSAQRKEAFKSIQYRRKERPQQLLLDMKVRWSSTFVMLTRAESRRQVDTFHLFVIVLIACTGSRRVRL